MSEQLTEQQMFDRVWQHFVVEGKPLSKDSSQGCFYRHKGACCAIGLFIPDGQYREDMEDRRVVSLIAEYPNACISFSHLGIEFLQYLQCCHDSHCGTIESNMRDMAMKRQLNIPPGPPADKELNKDLDQSDSYI